MLLSVDFLPAKVEAEGPPGTCFEAAEELPFFVPTATVTFVSALLSAIAFGSSGFW